MKYRDIDTEIEREIKRKIGEYYPNDNYTLKKIKKIKIRKRPPMFRCDLSENKQLFVKIFPETIDERVILQRRIEYENHIPIQKTLVFLKDINAVVIEGVTGRKLSDILIIHTFPLFREFFKNKLILYMNEIGKSVGNLQRLNSQRYEKLGNLKIDPILHEKIGSELFTKINNKLDAVKEIEIPITRTHGDLAPHNILVSEGNICFIDLDYYNGFDFCFRDPLTFSVGLELIVNRLFFSKKLFQVLNDAFYAAYNESSSFQPDEKLLKLLRLHEYCRYLACYENIKKYDFIGFINMKYITERIKKIASEI